MPNPAELVLLLLAVLAVFGGGRLPQAGDALGAAVRKLLSRG